MSATTTITQALATAVEQECLCLATQRAARVVAREYEAALRPTGLSSWQFTLLMMLARDEVPTIGELARDLAWIAPPSRATSSRWSVEGC